MYGQSGLLLERNTASCTPVSFRVQFDVLIKMTVLRRGCVVRLGALWTPQFSIHSVTHAMLGTVHAVLERLRTPKAFVDGILPRVCVLLKAEITKS